MKLKLCFLILLSFSLFGCLTLPVSGFLGTTNEQFLGKATGYITKNGNLEITSINGIKCTGEFSYDSKVNGNGNFKCSDGRFGTFLFTSNGIYGEGFGKTNKDEPFYFRFGDAKNLNPSEIPKEYRTPSKTN